MYLNNIYTYVSRYNADKVRKKEVVRESWRVPTRTPLFEASSAERQLENRERRMENRERRTENGEWNLEKFKYPGSNITLHDRHRS